MTFFYNDDGAWFRKSIQFRLSQREKICCIQFVQCFCYQCILHGVCERSFRVFVTYKVISFYVIYTYCFLTQLTSQQRDVRRSVFCLLLYFLKQHQLQGCSTLLDVTLDHCGQEFGDGIESSELCEQKRRCASNDVGRNVMFVRVLDSLDG